MPQLLCWKIIEAAASITKTVFNLNVNLTLKWCGNNRVKKLPT